MKENNKENKFRTQWDKPLAYQAINFPPSTVQPGMSPSISQMVKTRAVGGNVDAYEMDGMEEDAPFESEYMDFFDMQDEAVAIANAAAAEREAAEKSPDDSGKPPKSEKPQNADNQQVNEEKS